MRKMMKNKVSALSLFTLVLTVLSLIFFRVLTASSFESTENVPLVIGLLIAAIALGAVSCWKDIFHVPTLLTFAALASASAAFAAGRASYVAFYLTGDVMNTGLSVFFLLDCATIILALVLSIAAMAASGRKAK